MGSYWVVLRYSPAITISPCSVSGAFFWGGGAVLEMGWDVGNIRGFVFMKCACCKKKYVGSDDYDRMRNLRA
jgi:hypothetical protein